MFAHKPLDVISCTFFNIDPFDDYDIITINHYFY